MRVQVDDAFCQGHTMCNIAAPEVFGLDEEVGHAVVKLDDIPLELQSSVRAAVAGCPERAIKLVDH